MFARAIHQQTHNFNEGSCLFFFVNQLLSILAGKNTNRWFRIVNDFDDGVAGVCSKI
jgi:hypothetical protein